MSSLWVAKNPEVHSSRSKRPGHGYKRETLRENLNPFFFSFFFFHHTTCESTCDNLASSAANQGDKTVSVVQGGTATPGATER